MKHLGPACALLWAVSLASQGTEAPWELAEPAPVADGRAAVLDRLDELSCAECHREVVDEWASTAHALAWVDELYQEELGGRRKPETCHACHVPAPLHGEELAVRPKAREELRHFGVSCAACHLGPNGEMLGPRGLAPEAPAGGGEPAHRSAQSATLFGQGSNELCAACHRTTVGPVVGVAKDFEGTDQQGRGRTCVGCHMRPYERADGTLARSHRLQTPRDPAFLRRAFEISVEVSGRETVVVVANRAGHRVPGLVGRDLVFEVQLLDEAGAVVAAGELELTTRAFLPADGDARIQLGATGARVRMTGDHVDPRLPEPVRFLEEEFVP